MSPIEVDFRLADGTDELGVLLEPSDIPALHANAGYAVGFSPTTASAATKTGFAGVLLTSKKSGVFMVSVSGQYAAADGDVATLSVDTYTDAVPGTPLTLPANAHFEGNNAYSDNSGAGIAPSAGATAAATQSAVATTIGTLAADEALSFSGLVTVAGVKGNSFYVLFSVTNSAAARALQQICASAFEL